MRVSESSSAPSGRRYYPLSFKLEAVRLVEAGEQQRALSARLGIHPSSLIDWLRRYGTSVYQQNKKAVFSAARKRQIVAEVLDGRLSYAEAQLKYGLRHRKTLRSWVAAHHTAQAPIAAPSPLPPVAEFAPVPPEGEAAALTTQLQQARWQVEALHTLIDQAEATYKIEIRKKAGAKQSK
ncbi:MAG: transposase [Hymenobacteraceae bacterium]|nr:transposase [Hymenobacteraceae bacterium]